MNERTTAFPVRHAEIDGRHAWTWHISTEIGDIYITQFEHPQPDPYIEDVYMGYSKDKAERAFDTITTKMLKGKK